MYNEKRKKYNLKQLNIEIPAELYMQIKINAVKRNVTIRRWVLRQIVRGLKEELKG